MQRCYKKALETVLFLFVVDILLFFFAMFQMLGHTTLSMATHHLKNIIPADEIWEKANRILG